jgi:hypothetical protein
MVAKLMRLLIVLGTNKSRTAEEPQSSYSSRAGIRLVVAAEGEPCGETEKSGDTFSA